MLTRLEQTQQKYGGSNKIIDSWLAERQELLVKYCKLAGLPPFQKEAKSLPETKLVNSFCQILIDYLSAGHFEIYNDIVKQCQQHGPDSAALADQIYPQITATTDDLVSFNDKYSALDENSNLDGFDTDLSVIGQILEARLELEDQLIHTLYSKHS
ncbi:sigma D regulator [Psychrosphaera sp. F3M07]|jgi:regulator of sigma D|uniref:sigma D regulator n=1 Tax=Psychrosphaera sp. F3M07 TaxID=2841560 RepID=UPI001C09E37E|nr:sigma D regulator [Psychrosphaera sp. F3M07]MBU2918047.1 sigma D regulator [Psychrosphaera sp. F3M07]